MAEEAQSKTDTGQLRQIAEDVARRVLREELNTQITAAVEAAIQKCIDAGNIATTAQVEATVMQKIKPLDERIAEADQRYTSASKRMLEHAKRIALQYDTLSVAEAEVRGSIKRIDDNAQRLIAVENKTDKTRRLAETNQQRQKELRADLYGTDHMPVEQSLVGMLRSQHKQLTDSYQEIMTFLTKIDERVQQHDTFILNRKKIEDAVKGAFSFSWRWIKENRWRTALGGVLTAIIAALVRLYQERTPQEWELIINSILLGNQR